MFQGLLARRFPLHLNLLFLLLSLLPLFLLNLTVCQFLGVGEIVDGDGEEDVEQSVVAENDEHKEVDGVDEAPVSTAFRSNRVVHYDIPIFIGQNLIRNE